MGSGRRVCWEGVTRSRMGRRRPQCPKVNKVLVPSPGVRTDPSLASPSSPLRLPVVEFSQAGSPRLQFRSSVELLALGNQRNELQLRRDWPILLLARFCLLAGEDRGESVHFPGTSSRQHFLPRAASQPLSSRWTGTGPGWGAPGSPLEYIWVKNVWGEHGMLSALPGVEPGPEPLCPRGLEVDCLAGAQGFWWLPPSL